MYICHNCDSDDEEYKFLHNLFSEFIFQNLFYRIYRIYNLQNLFYRIYFPQNQIKNRYFTCKQAGLIDANFYFRNDFVLPSSVSLSV